MASENNLITPPNNPVPVAIPMLLGAIIAFFVISFFVFGIDTPHPEWGKFWRIRPLIITPLAGAVGGAFYAFLNYLSSRGKLNKIVAMLVSLVVYLIGLWLGIVLGLVGTMWD